MKHGLLATSFLALLAFAGCSGGKKVDSEQILQGITTSMCKKLTTCQPEAMPNEEMCRETMKTALQSHQALPKLQATQKQLDTCLGNIEKSDCSAMTGATPPQGCEFLK